MAPWAELAVLVVLGGLIPVLPHRIWYVSSSGSAKSGCGTVPKSSCDFTYAVRNSASGDSLLIVKGSMIDICTRPTSPPIELNKDLIIVGGGGTAGFRCSVKRKWPVALNATEPIKQLKHIQFHNLTLENFQVRFWNAQISIENCRLYNMTFQQGRVRRFPVCPYAQLKIVNSYWESKRLCDIYHDCSRLVALRIFCNETILDITNSSFYDVMVEVAGRYRGNVTVSNSTFGKHLRQETGLGGIRAILPPKRGSIFVTSCLFENQMHYEPILSALNIEEAALRVMEVNTGMAVPSELRMEVSNCIFRNNERGICVTRPISYLHIVNCSFVNNVAMHSGPAVRLAMADNVMAYITNSTFQGNAAGQETVSGRMKSEGYFDIDRDNGQIHMDSARYSGILDMVGKGGAIRLQKGDVTITDSTFLNNTASHLGGAIYVSANSTAIIKSSHFENTERDYHPIQGDVLYSTGAVTMRGVTVRVRAAKDHIAILRHSGKPWSMDVGSLWFQCPVGHRLLVVNNSAHKIVPEMGLIRSHRLDHMAYFCQTCGNHYYSLQRGYLNYTLTDNSTDYFTLRIDTKKPFQAHSVIFKYGNITCKKCPYGGACDAERGLSSLPNFWGYERDTSIVFQHCPPGYCCSKPNCGTYNSCGDHRTGTLCGKCQNGFSIALFSSTCVPNKQCGEPWFVGIVCILGLIYFLFLILQRDVRTCLLEGGGICADCSDIRHRRLSVRYVVKTNRRDTSEMRKLRESTPDPASMTQSSQEMDTLTNGNASRDPETPASPPSTEEENKEDGKDSGSGFLIILFYYFQDALLLHVNTVYTKTETKLHRQLKALLLSLFRFRLDVSQFLNDICIVPNMQQVPSLLVKSVFVPYVLLLFAFTYGLLRFFTYFNHTSFGFICTQNRKLIFECISTRLASGFILAMMFTYQKLATATFALLNCVPVENRSVLFIDGTIDCFQPWQYAVMAYAFTCVVPFCLVLMIGPPLLQRGNVSVRSFFLGCLVPLPALIVWIPRWVSAELRAFRSRKESTSTEPTRDVRLNKETETVLDILQGPFRDIEGVRKLGSLCWAGVLIARRLILFLCFTFINDALIRLLCMCAVCFVILLHHLYVQPYKSSLGNLSGAISAAALLVVGGINLVRAGFEAAEYIPQGPYSVLTVVFEDIENSLVLWVPLGGACLICLVLIVRLALLIITKLATFFNGLNGNSPTCVCNGQVAI